MDNFVRRLVSPPMKKISKFVSPGIRVADLGCGPGHFTLPLAELVGGQGKVYAVDSDPKSIRALIAKIEGFQGVIEAHISSASTLQFIPDRSIDFAFASGLLCCMIDHAGAVAEIKRILKPTGLAYISVTKVFRKKDLKAVSREEWNRILTTFNVRESGEGLLNRWATVSLE